MSVLFEKVEVGGQYHPSTGTRAKILRFMELPEGWHYGEGRPVPPETARHALSMVAWGDALGIATNAFPGTDGEVAVAFYVKEKVLEIVVSPTGPEHGYIETLDQDGDAEVEEVAFSSLPEVYERLLNLMAGTVWHSHASSIRFTSTSEYRESLTLHSSTPASQPQVTTP